ncbi:MAG: chemotaxis protein CheW [Ruminococcus sp.]|nr:chemotaxis protein CheW [Ruminococcus sp.]
MSSNTNENAEQHSLLLFKTGGISFACEFSDVLKIEPAVGRRLTPAPGFPAYMPGTVELEGSVAPVIDTSLRFGLGNGITGLRSCFILTRVDLEGAENAEQFERYDRCAALVDEVSGSDKVDELLPPPAVNAESYSRYLKGVYTKNGETIYVISPHKLIGV